MRDPLVFVWELPPKLEYGGLKTIRGRKKGPYVIIGKDVFAVQYTTNFMGTRSDILEVL